jgi:predicted DCC family thiol-disulfide oxidoreductase YuxK
MKEAPVVLFDGVCNYCNSWINFAIRHDKKGLLKFAPLQSSAGDRLSRQYNITAGTNSVILIEKGKVYSHSGAAIRIARFLQWPARMLYVFIAIPKFIRDPVYKWVARNRYKWFGRRETCMIPGPEVRARFLD